MCVCVCHHSLISTIKCALNPLPVVIGVIMWPTAWLLCVCDPTSPFSSGRCLRTWRCQRTLTVGWLVPWASRRPRRGSRSPPWTCSSRMASWSSGAAGPHPLCTSPPYRGTYPHRNHAPLTPPAHSLGPSLHTHLPMVSPLLITYVLNRLSWQHWV